MGHTTKTIAKIKEPDIFSLASNPNYIQFESRNSAPDVLKATFAIEVAGNPQNITNPKEETAFDITDRNGTVYTFYGTRNELEISDRVFYLSADKATLAENIRICLLQNTYLKRNFNIIVPLDTDGKTNGTVIRFYPKGVGKQYSFQFGNKALAGFYTFPQGSPSYITNNDSINNDSGKCEIELDIYSNTGIFPGCDDGITFGKPVISLSKAYANQPLWFDVNAVISNQTRYSNAFLSANGWCDAGTAGDMRLVAKRHDGINHETFYVSDVLYTLSGYNRNLEHISLIGQDPESGYVYDAAKNEIIRPLTHQPVLTHIKGQKQYFNFVLSDARHKENYYSISIGYTLRSQSGMVLGFVKKHSRNSNLLNIVNTIGLDIDNTIAEHAKGDYVGMVQVSLYRDNDCISEPLSFYILPGCLHRVNDFAFLNSLGGWSSFNFGGMAQTEFKTKANTISKTQTPAFGISDDTESVLSKNVEEQFIVQTTPIKAEVMEWLKEISSSIAVYELQSKRYVIVDDLEIKHNTKDDLFTAQMKYHYADSFNTEPGA